MDLTTTTFPAQKLPFKSKGDNDGVCNNSVFLVYQHINKKTGFVYVGITKHTEKPNRRWRGGRAYIDNSKFYNAIKKYGWDNFEHFCEYTTDRDTACKREIELIKMYKEMGISYNIANGGDGADSVSEETREKLRHYSPWIKGRHHSEEARKKISEAGKGRKPSAKVLAIFDATRRARKFVMSDAHKKRLTEVFGRPVYQLDKKTEEIIAEYPSTHQAELALRGHACGHIAQVCLGNPKRKTCYGYKWRYKDGNI